MRGLFLRFAACAALMAIAPISQAQQFQFTPGPALVGEPFQIQLSGLPPEADVEIRAHRVLGNPWRPGSEPMAYQSVAHFRPDAAGNLDLASAAPTRGSYAGVDPAGLLWSMSPDPSQTEVRLSDLVRFEALIDGATVAAGAIEVTNYASGQVTRAVRGFPGSVFVAPRDARNLPVIIYVDGADTNTYAEDFLLPALAARGYAVLKFATYALSFGGARPAVEGLPTRYVDIPIDRIEDIRRWLAQQPEVDIERIGLYGMSRNGAYVLLAASRFNWVDAVAALVPSDVVFEGWGQGVVEGTTSSYSWRGRPLAFVPYLGFREETSKIARGQPFRLRTPMDEGRWSNPGRVSAARIPVERYRGALFLAGGEQDPLWSSGHMVQNIVERRAEAGLETDFVIFPDAGHNLASDGLTPTNLFETGDRRAIEARAQLRTWRETIAFFERTLQPEASR